MKVLWILVIALAIVVVVLGVLLVGERERVVDIAAEEAAIRALPTEWVNAVNAKDAEGMVAGFTDDAWLLPPNAPLASGKEAIRTVWSELVETPSFSASNEVTKVEVSSRGDMGYVVGTSEGTWNDPEGNRVTSQEKWVAVYKKQPDGTWKCVVDIWNSDQPAPAPATE
jgi:uncharacterized protein (TIGR02246 family)